MVPTVVQNDWDFLRRFLRHRPQGRRADTETAIALQSVLESAWPVFGVRHPTSPRRSYSFGPDAGVSPGNHDLVLVADFDTVEDFQHYAAHQAHRDFVKERVLPILESRVAVQYVTADL
jgi:hypothetical protein